MRAKPVAAGIGGEPGPLCSRYVADSALVLEGFVLREGMGEGPRFGDALWDLAPAVHTPTATRTRLDFDTIHEPRVRVTLKEMVYHRLRWRRGRIKPSKPETACHYFVFGRRIFAEMPALVADISSVTPDTVSPWVVNLKESGCGPSTINALLRALCDLYEMAEVLTYHQLPCHPLRGQTASRVAGRPGRLENATPRIPEAVMGPLLAWALRYVERYADAILVALQRSLVAAETPVVPYADTGQALARYLARLRAEGRGLPDRAPYKSGLPGWKRAMESNDAAARLNWTHLSREAGINAWNLAPHKHGTNSEHRNLVLAALDELGYDADRCRDEDPESIEALLGYGLYGGAVQEQVAMLVTASYLVIAFLSGMRDSEVQGIVPGCVRRDSSRDGRTVRWKLRALVYKGVRGGGEVANWVVVEPVVTAVRVLERLHALRGLPANTRLFANPVGHKAADSVLPIFYWLDKFRDQANRLAVRSRELPVVAPHAGMPWHLESRQLRRTLAWYIANRPYGTIAGMLQYKHASVEMYEGSAGQSASGFRLEVEQEEALRAFDEFVALYEDWKRGAPIGGTGSARLERDLRAIRDEAGDWPGRTVDSRRLREMLRHASKHLHLGVLADCRFDRDLALCLRSVPGASGERPLLLMCRVDTCANACITRRHLPVWQNRAQEADEYLACADLSAPQRCITQRDRDIISAVIEPFSQGGAG